MMKQIHFFFCFLMTLLLLLCVTIEKSVAEPGEQKRKERIALLPFVVHAPDNMSYLKEGVRDMLASRLAATAGVMTVEKSKVDTAARGVSAFNAAQMQDLGSKLDADYLVTGSITALGGSVSLDAKVYRAANNFQAESFFATAAKEDDVVPAIDMLASNIAEKIFGKKRQTMSTAQIQPATQVGMPVVNPYQTAHPERNFMGSGSQFIRPLGITSPFGFTKSQNISLSLQAMDVGDVDGDGTEEIILAGKNEIKVYRRNGSRLAQTWGIPVLERYKVLAVSMADLNKNGRKEIYVSTTDNDSPNSFAVEWQDKGFVYLFQDVNLYIKAINLPGAGMVLAGQQAGLAAPFRPGIFQLEQTGGSLQKDIKLPVPEEINLFDFSLADLDNDGRNEVVSIDQYDRLCVYSSAGRLLWKSDDHFGGSTRHIGETKQPGIADIHSEENPEDDWTFIPSRIIIKDVNDDGLPDVVLNKNLSTASRVFRKLKIYPSGEIHCLTWNGIALTELWRTRKIDGYIADYQLHFNDDKSAQLYVGLVLRGGNMDFLSSKRSTVLMYNLDFSSEEKTEKTDDSGRMTVD